MSGGFQTTNRYVRIHFNVAMVGQTLVEPPDSGKDIQRSNLTCRIQYSATGEAAATSRAAPVLISDGIITGVNR